VFSSFVEFACYAVIMDINSIIKQGISDESDKRAAKKTKHDSKRACKAFANCR
jgi:hypothetical protein